MTLEQMDHQPRRAFLALCSGNALLVTAGCISGQSAKGTTRICDIGVENRDHESHDVELRLYRNDELIVEKTEELAPFDNEELDGVRITADELSSNSGEFVVRVTVDNGDSVERDLTEQGGSGYVRVRAAIEEDTISFPSTKVNKEDCEFV